MRTLIYRAKSMIVDMTIALSLMEIIYVDSLFELLAFVGLLYLVMSNPCDGNCLDNVL